MGQMHTMDRRQFLIGTSVLGGGMALGLVASSDADAGAGPWSEGAPAGTSEFTPWISIGPDDVMTVRVPTPDVGNGIMTQYAMFVAEELHCDWSKVRAEFAPPRRDFVENGAFKLSGDALDWFSGRSTRTARMKLLMQVGASARERLKTAAATQWKVPVTEITVKDSVLTHAKTGRTLRYGEVAAKAALVKLSPEPALKPDSEWVLIGKATPRKLQLPQIVDGSAIYGIDARPEGMVYAALKQSPVQGGKLKSYDAAAVMKMPGVLAVVTVDPTEKRGSPVKNQAPFGLALTMPTSAVAVIAEHYWQARKALDALPVEWDDGDGAKWKTTDQIYKSAIASLDKKGAKVEKTIGDVSRLDNQKIVVDAIYHTPFCDQAPLEPLNGTAMVTADRVDVWHPAQVPNQAFWTVADEAGIAPENVYFNQTFVGGAFGRRIFADDVRMVVAVAKKFPGRPVHTIWSREEATRQGRYRPMAAMRLKAGLDTTGMPKMLLGRVSASQGLGGLSGLSDGPYALAGIPNVLLESTSLPFHIMSGAYRGPGYNSHAFALETFIDECALAAGVDPMEYRMRLLAKWPDKAWVKCLEVVAEKSGWGKELPRGQGQGVAISNWGGDAKPFTGTTVAVVATVEISLQGKLNIHQIDLAFDTGRIANRDAVMTEMQGGVIFGLNMALNEELNVKNGQIVEGNFDGYPMLRMGDIPPKINIHFDAISGHERMSEIGEPPVGPVGPAVGNAIYAATRKRIRSTPFRTHDLSWT